MNESVILLAAADINALAPLRTRVDLVAAWHQEQIWVKGIADNAFRKLPALHTWRMDAQNRLFAAGALTPDRTLPLLEWQSLTTFIPVVMPPSGLPAITSHKHVVQLAPCAHTQESFAIFTDISVLEVYVASAPQIRLKHLRFATSVHGQVLIAGIPLPPVPGMGYTLHERILMPAGYDFDPPIIRSLVAERLDAGKSNFLLFHVNGAYEIIPDTSFVPVTRSAVRLTAETLSHVL
jgi:hypothetical protein